jgi:hypothetical protein
LHLLLLRVHFYSIYNPATNYDNGWGTVGNTIGAPEIENKASAIRFKRINSEFALVDFNITVKVENPALPGGGSGKFLGDYIDFGSPRFTQYLRFVYVPDEDFDSETHYRQDIAQDIYGNGFWFSNWSSFKQWYSGTAVVGAEANQTVGAANRDYYGSANSQVGSMLKYTAGDDSPFFMDGSTSGGQGWNGNLLEMLSYYVQGQYYEENIYKSEGNASSLSIVEGVPPGAFGANFPTNVGNKSGVYSMFGHDRRILNIAKRVFNRLNSFSIVNLDADVAKQWGMTRYLGPVYSMWRNQAFMRNKNIQWRMVPAKAYKFTPGAGPSNTEQNNTFVLEIQFSDPMLHVDTPLGQRAFYEESDFETDTKKPYQYLTVSGQSIVRYAETVADVRT